MGRHSRDKKSPLERNGVQVEEEKRSEVKKKIRMTFQHMHSTYRAHGRHGKAAIGIGQVHNLFQQSALSHFIQQCLREAAWPIHWVIQLHHPTSWLTK
jgi:hypothetical protein